MGMFSSLLDYTRRLLTLAHSVHQNSVDIDQLQHKIGELTELVARLRDEMQRALAQERHQRETLFLKIQNELLRHGRGLPPPRKRRKRRN